MSGVSPAEERVDCDNILHQRRSDQSEQQRDTVVNVVYVPGVDISVLKGQLSCVPMCKLLLTQCTTGSSQRPISAMTRCHWRSELKNFNKCEIESC